jgi:OmpA-OmpF porin, OOP family
MNRLNQEEWMRSEQKNFLKWSAFLCILLLTAVCCSSIKTKPPEQIKTLVVLLPDGNSPNGAMAVGQGSTITVLDTPLTAAKVGSDGRVEKVNITQEEVEREFSEALAAIPLEPVSFTLYFEEGSTSVLSISKDTLQKIFEEVAKRQASEVQITGHTDTVGDAADNDKLSTQRAEAIKEMLISKGLKSNFIRAVGRGERELLVSTPDNTNEPKNRRVEVLIR